MDFQLSEELKMVQGLARDFVNDQLKPRERDILGRAADLNDARASLPPETEAELVKMVKDMGMWGVGVPEELGGVGLSTLGTCLVEEELAQTIIPFNFGDVTPLLFDAGNGQKEKYLLPAVSGEKRPYLALMEPDRGADPSGVEMKALKDGGDFVLNGKKVSFSRQGEDYFAVVFAATDGKASGVTCFLVDKDTPGFTVSGGGERSGWLSQLREPVTLTFDNCRVTGGDILGEQGRAFHLGKKWLPSRRVVRGARCVGVAQRLLDEATVQAQSWQSFGQSIYQRPSVRAALADIAVMIHAGRLVVYEAAWKADRGENTRREAAMVKLYTTQVVHDVADRVAHIFNGPPNIAGMPMENLCRHALAASATELALDLQRRIIAGDIIKGLKVS